MGYTHGIKWTTDLIKERIMEVVREMELGRMPSRSECDEYYHDTSLTNAISKRIGWYNLANELGLPIKDSETYFGKKYEQIALEQFIARGYEARRMPQNFPYDLLVEDCLKVDVKASRLYKSNQGKFYSFNLEKPFSTCDLYVLYLVSDDKSIKTTLILPSKFVATNTQVSVGEKTSKYYKYADRWDYVDDYIDFLLSVS